jgi:RNA polymerase sigma-70 factor (ECF subfamily)
MNTFEAASIPVTEGGRPVAGERWQDYEDAELVVECLVGNYGAFDGLVARYRSAVLATVLRLVRSRPVAEDICQEAFVRAFRALPRLRDPGRFPAWLHAIARREVIRHAPTEARAADHMPLDEPLLEQGIGQEASGWETIERREEGDAVRQAMASLPEEFQLVLTLRYWADMPLEQISAYLGRPLSTVKWRLHRARALMRQQLTQPMESHGRSQGGPSPQVRAGAAVQDQARFPNTTEESLPECRVPTQWADSPYVGPPASLRHVDRPPTASRPPASHRSCSPRCAPPPGAPANPDPRLSPDRSHLHRTSQGQLRSGDWSRISAASALDH